MQYLARIDPRVFQYLGLSIREGIQSTDVSIRYSNPPSHYSHFFLHSTHAYTALDQLLTAVVLRVSRARGQPDALAQMTAQNQDIFSQLLSYMLNIMMFEDCKNHWSASRPLLGLILLLPRCTRILLFIIDNLTFLILVLISFPAFSMTAVSRWLLLRPLPQRKRAWRFALRISLMAWRTR